jgi:hypothetical protein
VFNLNETVSRLSDQGKVFAQASEAYVRDDKSILQVFSWKNTKRRHQLEGYTSANTKV